MQANILIVEDEDAIARLLEYNLKQEGFATRHVDNADDALICIEEQTPDLIVLDWMLPTLSGVEMCKRIRERDDTSHIPIIMITARGEEADKITGLDSGADDYMVKPFSPKEMISRIHAIFRRTRPALETDILTYGPITLNTSSYKVHVEDVLVHLGPTEFKLLGHFLERPGKVSTREQLLDSVWGQDVYVEIRTVDVHIRRLRKALNAAKGGTANMIKTVRSAGYMIDSTENE